MLRLQRIKPLLSLADADVNAAALVVPGWRIAIDGAIERIGLIPV